MKKMSKRKVKRKLKVKNLLILVVTLLLIIIFSFVLIFNNSLKPVSKNSEQVLFTIKSGESGKTILKKLEDQNIIKNDLFAGVYAKINKLTDLKMGDYLLDRNWNVKTILTTLNDPNAAMTNTVSITFVEGDWAKHIAAKIAENTNVLEEDLLNLWNDENYIRSLMDKYPFLTEDIFNDNSRIYLEGYLAPNTYNFFKETTEQDVTEIILNETLRVYNMFLGDIQDSNLSIHEIYTLASIVQYEASDITNMKNIAGVFFNRLEIDMPLQSSVTVCYALDINKDDDWLKCEVNPHLDSPYNTYMYRGLPPGPILNPGVDAIDAVLNPNDNDYYYFMADVYGDGTVYYATTLEEHNANVNKYLN